MSRISEMSRCIADLKAAAAALLSVAETLTALCSSNEPAADKPASKPITKEKVRAELASKTAAGYGAQVRALLKKYGAAQLSAVKPEDYPNLLLEAQAIGDEVGADG
ncbi:MAG: DNA ligase [Clostridia bacterium]|nr:DNA ligase [Clostridia bacterium]